MDKYRLIDKLNYFDIMLLNAVVYHTKEISNSSTTTKEITQYMETNFFKDSCKQNFSRSYYKDRIKFLVEYGLLEVTVSGQRIIKIKENRKIAVCNFLEWYKQLIEVEWLWF